MRGLCEAALVALAGVTPGWTATESERLHYVAVNGDGVLSSARAEEPVNPASVVKVATTLWALDRLGADHRYLTSIGYVGEWDRSTGILVGDLVIRGGDDPDFQWENAFLIARELNRLGIVRVEGRVRIQERFWLGWEHGVEKRVTDPTRLAEKMGRRLIAALDSGRWTKSHRNTWKAMCERRGWNVAHRPRVVVTGGASRAPTADAAPLLIHRSSPLAVIMRRFNVYSNNDIVRVADGLGTVAELQTFVNRRLEIEADGIRLETASGERRNRMTAEQMVALLTELEVEAESQHLELGQLLPMIGCDPGSTRRMFPALAGPELVGSVTCKTGTLTHTDGGVVVLAGTFTSANRGPVVFAVAATEVRGRIDDWRRVQQRWVLELMDQLGGAVRQPCGPPLPFSDADAEIEVIAGAAG